MSLEPSAERLAIKREKDISEFFSWHDLRHGMTASKALRLSVLRTLRFSAEAQLLRFFPHPLFQAKDYKAGLGVDVDFSVDNCRHCKFGGLPDGRTSVEFAGNVHHIEGV